VRPKIVPPAKSLLPSCGHPLLCSFFRRALLLHSEDDSGPVDSISRVRASSPLYPFSSPCSEGAHGRRVRIPFVQTCGAGRQPFSRFPNLPVFRSSLFRPKSRLGARPCGGFDIFPLRRVALQDVTCSFLGSVVMARVNFFTRGGFPKNDAVSERTLFSRGRRLVAAVF